MLDTPCCSSCYSLFDVITPLVVLCSSLVDTSASLAAHYVSLVDATALLATPCFSLVNATSPLIIPFVAPYSTCSTLLFLLLFFVQCTWCCYFSCYSLLDTIVPFDVLCSTLLLLLLVQTLFYYTMMLFLLLFMFLMFKIVFPTFSFLQVWEELSKFKFLGQTWKVRCFFFNLSLLMNFCIIHTIVFGKFWLKMCLFVVCRNYLDIIHLILHIAFHLHNCIVCFFNTLHLFLFFFQLLINV